MASVKSQRLFELIYFRMNLNGISNECNLVSLLNLILIDEALADRLKKKGTIQYGYRT